MENIKVIITGSKGSNKHTVAELLTSLSDDFKICQTFTESRQLNNNEYFMDAEDITIAVKNNALLYISSDDNGTRGITIENFEGSNISYMSIKELNSIPTQLLTKYNTLIIWLDSKHQENKKELKVDIEEARYLWSLLETTKYMYFLDGDVKDIAATIHEYINADDDLKSELLEENS